MARKRTELELLRGEAVAALEAYVTTPGYPVAEWEDAQRRASHRVTAAVTSGVSHEWLAAESGLSRFCIAGMVEDVDKRAAILRYERHCAEAQLAEALDETRRFAVRLVREDRRRKTDVAELLGITRTTLDVWLDSAKPDTKPADG